MYGQRLRADDLQYERGEYSPSTGYARTKRAQVVLSERWARELRGDGVIVHAMHPGWAATGGLAASLPGFSRIARPILRTDAQGADTTVWLAAAAEPGRSSGGFWHDRRARARCTTSGARRRARPTAARSGTRASGSPAPSRHRAAPRTPAGPAPSRRATPAPAPPRRSGRWSDAWMPGSPPVNASTSPPPALDQRGQPALVRRVGALRGARPRASAISSRPVLLRAGPHPVLTERVGALLELLQLLRRVVALHASSSPRSPR